MVSEDAAVSDEPWGQHRSPEDWPIRWFRAEDYCPGCGLWGHSCDPLEGERNG